VTVRDDIRRWRLLGTNDWGKKLFAGDDGDPVRVSPQDIRLGQSITLAVNPRGPSDPSGSPASLGGLTTPPNVSARDGEILLASTRRRRLMRWDPARGELRDWIGLESLGPGGADAPPLVLTRSGQLLVIAEHKRSRLLALNPAIPLVVDAVTLPARQVIDLEATKDGAVLILVHTPQHVPELWCWKPGVEQPRSIGGIPSAAAPPAIRPSRLVSDADGRIYVFDQAAGRVLALPASAGKAEWQSVVDVLDHFPPLPVVIEPTGEGQSWRIRIPSPGARPPYPWPAPTNWPAYSPEGERLRLQPDAPVGPAPHVFSGSLEVGPLDGSIPRVVWDHLELNVVSLPAGTAIELRTRTSDDRTIPEPAFGEWSEKYRLTESGSGGEHSHPDFAVLSPPGRYLWLELKLEGGAASPRIDAITVVTPRRGVVDFLPLVFRETDQDTRFLERFIGGLERTWAPLERAVDEFDRELRTETASSQAMLDFLGSWFDQPMEPDWAMPARRRAVQHATQHLFRRGTPEAVQAALRLYLANRWKLPPESLENSVFLWEHFRSRLPLHAAGAGGGGQTSGTLTGSEILHRLRLGASALGVGTLRDVGSEETDPVTLEAHRFSVFVPRAFLPSTDEVRGFLNVLTREQPAEAQAELMLIDPRMRIGVQSTLGVDSILGVYPSAKLAGDMDDPAQPPAARLDYDCLLADVEAGEQNAIPWRITDFGDYLP
jgi:phage tail-like protein